MSNSSNRKSLRLSTGLTEAGATPSFNLRRLNSETSLGTRRQAGDWAPHLSSLEADMILEEKAVVRSTFKSKITRQEEDDFPVARSHRGLHETVSYADALNYLCSRGDIIPQDKLVPSTDRENTNLSIKCPSTTATTRTTVVRSARTPRHAGTGVENECPNSARSMNQTSPKQGASVFEKELDAIHEVSQEMEAIVHQHDKDARELLSKIPNAERVKIAARLIHDIIMGTEPIPRSNIAHWIYELHNTRLFRTFIMCISLLHLGLVCFEMPSFRATQENGAITTEAQAAYYVEIGCIIVYCIDLVLRFTSMGAKYFFGKGWNVLTLICVFICTLDVLLQASFSLRIPRFSRIIRPFLVVDKSKRFRSFSATCLRTLPRLFHLIVLITFSTCFFGFLGVYMFSNRYLDEDGIIPDDNFEDLPSAMISLFIFLTTDNFPDLMFPAYRLSPFFLIYFIAFLCICLYLLLTITVALLFDNYKQLRKKKIIRDRIQEKQSLAAAFYLLDTKGEGFIENQAWKELLSHLPRKYRSGHAQLLFDTIDEDGDGRIDMQEFFASCEVLQLRFHKEDVPVSILPQALAEMIEKYLPKDQVTQIMDSQVFSFLIFVVIFVDILCVGIILYDPSQKSPGAEQFDHIVLAILLFELSLRLLAEGFVGISRDNWKIFEATIVVIPLFAIILTGFYDGETRRYLQCLYVMKTLRLVSVVKSMRVFIENILQMLPVLLAVMCLVLALMYSYAILGMELYWHKFPKELSAQQPPATFDSFGVSLMTLLRLIAMANWSDIMHAAIDATTIHSAWFFISFISVAAMLFLNILMALIIEIFVAALEFQDIERYVIVNAGDDGRGNLKSERYRVSRHHRRWSAEFTRPSPEELEKIEEEERVKAEQSLEKKKASVDAVVPVEYSEALAKKGYCIIETNTPGLKDVGRKDSLKNIIVVPDATPTDSTPKKTPQGITEKGSSLQTKGHNTEEKDQISHPTPEQQTPVASAASPDRNVTPNSLLARRASRRLRMNPDRPLVKQTTLAAMVSMASLEVDPPESKKVEGKHTD